MFGPNYLLLAVLCFSGMAVRMPVLRNAVFYARALYQLILGLVLLYNVTYGSTDGALLVRTLKSIENIH
jgi:hypothetical protein